jgi:hypothetical protein
MINPFAEVDWTPDVAARRKFGRSLIVGFPIVAAFWLVVGRLMSGEWHVALAAWVAGAGVAAGAVFAALPVVAGPFYVVWYGLACTMGIVVGNLVLALSYYAVLVPIGLIRRLFGRRSLERTIDRRAVSYWRRAPPPAEPSQYLRQF